MNSSLSKSQSYGSFLSLKSNYEVLEEDCDNCEQEVTGIYFFYYYSNNLKLTLKIYRSFRFKTECFFKSF